MIEELQFKYIRSKIYDLYEEICDIYPNQYKIVLHNTGKLSIELKDDEDFNKLSSIE